MLLFEKMWRPVLISAMFIGIGRGGEIQKFNFEMWHFPNKSLAEKVTSLVSNDQMKFATFGPHCKNPSYCPRKTHYWPFLLMPMTVFVWQTSPQFWKSQTLVAVFTNHCKTCIEQTAHGMILHIWDEKNRYPSGPTIVSFVVIISHNLRTDSLESQ